MCYIFFRSLSCQRITLHKNLFFSYVLNSMFTIAHLIAVVPNPGLVKRDPVSTAWLLSILTAKWNHYGHAKNKNSHSSANDSHLGKHIQRVQILRISLKLALIFHQAIKIFGSCASPRLAPASPSIQVCVRPQLLLAIATWWFPRKPLRWQMP